MKRIIFFLPILLSFLFGCQDCPDCPSPPEQLQFQIVNILGDDLTVGSSAEFDKKQIRLTYFENGTERETLLELDTFNSDRTIFKAMYVPLLANRGILKYNFYTSESAVADTLETDISLIKTVCCDYKLYNYLLVNGTESELSTKDDYVFFIQK